MHDSGRPGPADMPARRIRAVPGEELRALMSRVPSGVAVVTVDTNGNDSALPSARSSCSRSNHRSSPSPSHGRQRCTNCCARRTASPSRSSPKGKNGSRSTSPGASPRSLCGGIAVEAGDSGAPLLTGALGWLECRLHNELQVGTHTLFVGEVVRVQLGKDAPPLQRSHGEYTPGDRSPSSSTSTACSSTSDSALSTTMANAQGPPLSPSELHGKPSPKRSPTPETKMTRPSDAQEEHRKTALTAFLAARVSEGYGSRRAPTPTRSSLRPSEACRSATGCVE